MRFEALLLTFLGHLLTSKTGPRIPEVWYPQDSQVNITVAPPLNPSFFCHCSCGSRGSFLAVVFTALVLGWLLGALTVVLIVRCSWRRPSFDASPSPRRRGHGVLVGPGTGPNGRCVLQ